ncbi:MAG: (d)CMP kinase [Firmicutes bacterium]|nr:(d)CMP kinase [Bacillota bacterium]
MKNQQITIAIDGPSGAGKSTIAKRLAVELGIAYLDTGAMYRAVGLKAHELSIDFSDISAIEMMLEATEVDVVYKDGIQQILLDGKDVSVRIREHFVSKLASDISAIPCVRIWLVERQRKVASVDGCVLDGRDIGTYVLPNASFKFFLTASLKVRAKRRFDELIAKGMSADISKIESDIAQRDHNDSTRDFAPLKKADDAIEVDSSNLGIDEVVEVMLKKVKSKR